MNWTASANLSNHRSAWVDTQLGDRHEGHQLEGINPLAYPENRPVTAESRETMLDLVRRSSACLSTIASVLNTTYGLSLLEILERLRSPYYELEENITETYGRDAEAEATIMNLVVSSLQRSSAACLTDEHMVNREREHREAEVEDNEFVTGMR
ncbi:hypothetical protein V1523DRAFT_424544 [Lipomyces doorenjongii]